MDVSKRELSQKHFKLNAQKYYKLGKLAKPKQKVAWYDYVKVVIVKVESFHIP